MTTTGRLLGVLLVSLAAVAAAVATASAQQPAAPAYVPTLPLAPPPPAGMPSTLAAVPGSMAPAPIRVVLSEVVEPKFREAVLTVARKPTISTRGFSPDVVTTSAVYDWLLAHPDRVALAWRRMKVPCVEIVDSGNGVFTWADGEGSELTWQTVGRFPDGVIWYATGKVKPSVLTPSIPIRAVVVMHSPKRPGKDSTVIVSPSLQAFLHTDSKAANVVLRMLGPTAPQIAEQGADQLLLFFSGVARYVQAHPEKADALLAPAVKKGQ